MNTRNRINGKFVPLTPRQLKARRMVLSGEVSVVRVKPMNNGNLVSHTSRVRKALVHGDDTAHIEFVEA